MLEKVQGIVLRTIKYGDTKMIVHLFTLRHGRQAFVTSVAHSRKSQSQMAFWAPLSMVEFMADIRPSSATLPKTKDVRLYYNYVDVPYNPIKSSIALFLAEFLSAALNGETENVALYRYVETSLQWFDNMVSSADLGNFHLVFLLRLTRFVGILPNLDMPQYASSSLIPIFDLRASEYCMGYPLHRDWLTPEESAVLPLLFRLNFATMHVLRLTRTQRNRFLDAIELYYRLHLPSFPEIKSISVLHEVFA